MPGEGAPVMYHRSALSRHDRNDVADAVDHGVEAEIGHPRDDEVSACLVFIGQRQATGPFGPLDPPDSGKFGEALRETIDVDSEVGHAGTVFAAEKEICLTGYKPSAHPSIFTSDTYGPRRNYRPGAPRP